MEQLQNDTLLSARSVGERKSRILGDKCTVDTELMAALKARAALDGYGLVRMAVGMFRPLDHIAAVKTFLQRTGGVQT